MVLAAFRMENRKPSLFPCDKIFSMLKRSDEYKKRCKELCSAEEYRILEKAFFEKEINLKK